MHTPKSSMLLHLIFFDLKENPQRETDSTINVVSESQNGTVNRNIKGLMLCKDNLPHIFSIAQNDDCEMCLFFNKLTSWAIVCSRPMRSLFITLLFGAPNLDDICVLCFISLLHLEGLP